MLPNGKKPISCIVDDSAPLIHCYYAHTKDHKSFAGIPLVKYIPNEFLDLFCEVVEKNGIKGKFSIVPSPLGQGDIVQGISGFPREKTLQWLDTVRKRILPYFSVGPEMITHGPAVDLEGGALLPCNEEEWASTQNSETLEKYITRALALFKAADLQPTGVVSPWNFAKPVEHDDRIAISNAFHRVFDRDICWYFLHVDNKTPNVRAEVVLEQENRKVISIPATTADMFWKSLEPDFNAPSPENISAIADRVFTEDGKSGCLAETIQLTDRPILLSHWQSLFSNGNYTGLYALDLAVRRFNALHGNEYEWVTFDEQTALAVSGYEHP